MFEETILGGLCCDITFRDDHLKQSDPDFKNTQKLFSISNKGIGTGASRFKYTRSRKKLNSTKN